MMCSRPGAAIIGNCLWKTPQIHSLCRTRNFVFEFRSNAPWHNDRVGPSLDGPRTGHAPSFNRDLWTSASDAFFNEAATLQIRLISLRALFHSDPVCRGDLARASWLGWSLSQHRGGGHKNSTLKAKTPRSLITKAAP
jgi:hypothetical protein